MKSCFFLKTDTAFRDTVERTSLERRLRQQQNAGKRLDIPTEAQSQEMFLTKSSIPSITALIEEITNAFDCSPVLCKIFDPVNLLEELTDLTSYGKKDVETPADFYGQSKIDIFQGIELMLQYYRLFPGFNH